MNVIHGLATPLVAVLSLLAGMALPLPSSAAGVGLARLGGPDRYAVAAAVSATTYPSGAPVAYLANGYAYADALGGAVAAARAGGPVLLVTTTTLPAVTKTELARLHPATVIALGGPASVSDTVLALARTAAQATTLARLGGPDRYAVAAAVSAATYPSGAPVAYLANGYAYADALGGAVAAARAGGPVLLVTTTTLPAVTKTELARLHPATVIALGGPASVSDTVLALARTAAKAQ